MSNCIAITIKDHDRFTKINLSELSKEIVRLREVWKILEIIYDRSWFNARLSSDHVKLNAIRNTLRGYYPRYVRLMKLFTAVRNTSVILEAISERTPALQEHLPNTEFLHGMKEWVEQIIDENNNPKIILYVPRNHGRSTVKEAMKIYFLSMLYNK